MQLVPKGPQIPESLVDIIFEDKAVFFCGAGVSVNAGLPNFREFTEKISNEINADNDLFIKEEICHSRYDRAFQIFSTKYDNSKVFSAIQASLKLSDKADVSGHEAILRLANQRNSNNYRIVTTNFDEAFQTALSNISSGDFSIPDVAPKLPPVRENWWSIVYLHGRLSGCQNLDDLVLTSSSFGRAYLTEGWAASFIRKLFENFTVIFLGYSIDDPVMRYIVDAYQAEKGWNNRLPEGPYAFISFEEGDSDSTEETWKLKGVQPIIYPIKNRDHRSLYESFRKLAELKKIGEGAKYIEIKRIARSAPDIISDQDISCLKWAFRSDINKGLTALLNSKSPHVHKFLDTLETWKLKPKVPFISKQPVSMQAIWSTDEYDLHIKFGLWLGNYLEDPDILKWVIEKGGYLSPPVLERLRFSIQDIHKNGQCDSVLIQSWQLLLNLPAFQDSLLGSSGNARDLNTVIYYPGASHEEKALALFNALCPLVEVKHGESIYNSEENNDHVCYYINLDIDFPQLRHGYSMLNSLAEKNDFDDIVKVFKDQIFQLLQNFDFILQYVESINRRISYSMLFTTTAVYELPLDYHTRDWELIPVIIGRALLLGVENDPEDVKCAIMSWDNVLNSVILDRITLWLNGKKKIFNYNEFTELFSVKYKIYLDDTACFIELINTNMILYEDELTKKDKKNFSDTVVSWFNGTDKEEYAQNKCCQFLLLIHSQEKIESMYPDLENTLHAYLEKEKLWDQNREKIPYDGKDHNAIPCEHLFLKSPVEILEYINIESPFYDKRLFQLEDCVEKSDLEKTLLLLQYCTEEVRVEAMIIIRILNGITRKLRKGDDKERHAIPATHLKNILIQITKLPKSIFEKSELTVFELFQSITLKRKQDLFEPTLQTFDYLFEIAKSLPAREFANEHDIITVSISTWQYNLINALFHLLPETVQSGEYEFSEIVKSKIEILLDLKGYDRKYVILNLCSHLKYLYFLDAEWTKEHLFPCFSWSDEIISKYAWTGFLMNPQRTADMGKILFKHYKRALDELSEYESVRSNLTAILIVLHKNYSGIVADDDLKECIKFMTDEQQASFIDGVIYFIPDDESEKKVFWDTWLEKVFSKFWPAENSIKTQNLSMSLSKLLLQFENIFPKVYETISSYIIPFENFDWIVNKLNDREGKLIILRMHTKCTLDFVYQIHLFNEKEKWKIAETNKFLDKLSEIDDKIVEDPKFKDLKDEIRKFPDFD